MRATGWTGSYAHPRTHRGAGPIELFPSGSSMQPRSSGTAEAWQRSNPRRPGDARRQGLVLKAQIPGRSSQRVRGEIATSASLLRNPDDVLRRSLSAAKSSVRSPWGNGRSSSSSRWQPPSEHARSARA
jgi:hypothetical protein